MSRKVVHLIYVSFYSFSIYVSVCCIFKYKLYMQHTDYILWNIYTKNDLKLKNKAFVKSTPWKVRERFNNAIRTSIAQDFIIDQMSAI